MLDWISKALANIVHPQPRSMGLLDLLPRTTIDYKKEVGDGLNSSVVMGPLGWIASVFPEARLVVSETDDDGEDQRRELMQCVVGRLFYYPGDAEGESPGMQTHQDFLNKAETAFSYIHRLF